ncbi:hypothetical protein B0A52_00239 [Exophiala mesophila]|uniref:Uncharacterized protein n=1 Tax=Exophiala mesophila TaxID=212818 RepID=A0A438NJK1_EXOME|nr:hypothetical protein B0A52_00239 [Exophiala mesophila]
MSIDTTHPSTGHGFVPTRRNDTYPAIDPLKADHSCKYVLITGAARGLGLAMATSFAQAGASGIAILDMLDMTSARDVILNAVKAAGRAEPKILTLTVDVTDEGSVSQAVKSVEAEFARLDILINNAGYVGGYTPLGQSDPSRWWRAWEVNVKGPYLVTRGFLPLILQGTDKTVIVISSIGAHVTIPGGSAYETTKYAVLRINHYLMAEYGSQGLLAYAVAPGGVLTDMSKGFQYQDRLTDTPQMVADTLVFLTKERREWLAERYIDSRWDMEELMEKKEEIVQRDLLKVRMTV